MKKLNIPLDLSIGGERRKISGFEPESGLICNIYK